MFFTVSGFLVAGSLERCRTLVSFVGLRVIRIYPALAVETTLSALLLGPALTVYPLSSYFTDHQFFTYLLNITGDVHYTLPGVFLTNPFPFRVNNQLWTVPYELGCYTTLSVLVLLGIKRFRIIAPAAAVASVLIFVAARLLKNHGQFVPFEGAVSGPLLITFFLAGLSVFLYRNDLPFNKFLFWASAALSIALLGVIPYGDCLAALPVAYLTVYLGLLNPPRNFVIGGADYSYGIYLYSFVVQQTISDILPWSRAWYLNIAISLPLSIAIAAFSWHVIEKPALQLRKKLARVEAWYLGLRPSVTAPPLHSPTSLEVPPSHSETAPAEHGLAEMKGESFEGLQRP
jgi:peptidoglycan/LPS O-acetylase OafA/YrhL